MLSPQFVNAKDLRKAIGELNSTGILENKIRTVGVKKDVMVKTFLEAIQGIEPGSEAEGKLADSTILFFNSIVEGEDPSPEEQKKAETKTKAKKESAPKGPSNEQKGYDLMKAGATDEEWAKVYGDFYAAKGIVDEKFILKRIAIYKNIAKKRLAKEGAPVEETPAPEATAEEAAE